MNSKEYTLPNGKKAVFEYDVCGIGKITLECMDELMDMIADRPQGEWKFVGSSIEMIWECPFCGCRTFGFKKDLPNYCSNCGADLRGTDVDDKENDESH